MMRRFFPVMLALGLLGTVGSSWGLDLIPKKNAEAESKDAVGTRFWLMSHGSEVGYRVAVEINGNKITTVKRPGKALEVTQHIHPGLNTVRFVSKDAGKKVLPSSNSELTITIGPEGRRERQGNLSRLYVELKEMPIHFVRPAGHRADESVVELHFSVKDAPNPALKKRYVLYSQGTFSGHVVHVGLNGAPLVDIAAPGAHFDLNPFLKEGQNEIVFSSSRLGDVPFTTGEREALHGKALEVGVGIAGDYDPVDYAQPVTQVTSVVANYSQPADQEEPEEKETATIMAE